VWSRGKAGDYFKRLPIADVEWKKEFEPLWKNITFYEQKCINII
jgi:hypothetical protein